jgi:TRAP-type C4-dicarboxylate transport system permease small subunit
LLEVVLAGMIFLIYPVLASSHGHITVDLIPVSPRVQSLQRMLGAALGVVLFGIIAGCLVRQMLRAADFGEKTATLNLPIAWILGTLALFAAVTCIAFLAATLRAFESQDSRNSIIRELESL